MITRLLPAIAATVTALFIVACASGDDDSPTTTTEPLSSASPTPDATSAQALILYRDSVGDLIVRDLTSGESHKQSVNFGEEIVVQAVCSPDGSSIAYLKQKFVEINRQIVIHGEGATVDPIALPSVVQSITWVPDATRLALTEWDGIEQQASMSILDVATGETTRIASATDYIGAPAWSPDGSQIAYYLQEVTGEWSEIWLLDLATGETRRLSPEGDTLWLDPSWAPDGSTLLASAVVGQTIQLYRLDPETGEPSRLTQTTDIFRRGPQFSPDGRTIAYTGSIVAPGISVKPVLLHSFGIFLMNSDGSDERALTPDPRLNPSADPILDAYFLGWCRPGPWLDGLWTEEETS